MEFYPQEPDFHLFRNKKQEKTPNLPPVPIKKHRKVVSSPDSSPFKEPIPYEIPANNPKIHIRSSNSFLAKYQENNSKMPTEKYKKSIERLNQEIQIMSVQLKQSHETISFLTNQLNEINFKHAMQIQEIHERHEQKIKKVKNDLERLFGLNGINKNTEKMIIEKDLEIEFQEKKFKTDLAKMTYDYEQKLANKGKECKQQIGLLKEQFLNVVLELKYKFFTEIENIQERYKEDLDKLKEQLKKFNFRLSESDISTALEIEGKRQTSITDLQIIEELSIQNDMLKFIEDKDQEDLSLRMLVDQIGFEAEISISDIFK